MLGAGEDQERAGLGLQHGLQQRQFLALFDLVKAEVDLFHRTANGAHLDAYGVGNVGLHQVLHGRFDGGRIEQRLPSRGSGGHDARDSGQETHVEHAIGLIQHQDFDCGQVDQLAAQKIV